MIFILNIHNSEGLDPNIFSFLKLCHICEQVDWKTLLSALVGDTVSPDTTVQLYFDKYFDSLFNKLSDHFKTDNKHR
jgi:hypothetical protein